MSTTMEQTASSDEMQFALDFTEREFDELQRCESVVDRHQKAFSDVVEALQTIRNNRLYRASHKTWDEYLSERWGWSRQHAARLMRTAEPMEELRAELPEGIPLPSNEAQIRPLSNVSDGDRTKVYLNAYNASQVEGVALRASHVQAAADAWLGKETSEGAAKMEPIGSVEPVLPLDIQGDAALGFAAPHPVPTSGTSTSNAAATSTFNAVGTSVSDEDWEKGYDDKTAVESTDVSAQDNEAPEQSGGVSDARHEAAADTDAAEAVKGHVDTTAPVPAAPAVDTPVSVVDKRSSAPKSATPAPAQKASAQPASSQKAPAQAAPSTETAAPSVLHPITPSQDDWLWEQDLTVTAAVAELQRIWDMRLTDQAQNALMLLTDAWNTQRPHDIVTPTFRLESILVIRAQDAGLLEETFTESEN